jgi:hypothetical protein
MITSTKSSPSLASDRQEECEAQPVPPDPDNETSLKAWMPAGRSPVSGRHQFLTHSRH